ncbi:MAG: adenylate kinase [Armatimonadota bacterium]
MNIILLGSPGAGKGTQAEIVAKELSIPHISTGDIFRENIAQATSLGKEAKTYIDKGLLVPDSVTNKMVEHRLLDNDCDRGFILDGYPRTINQANFLKTALSVHGKDITVVIDIVLDEEEVLRRLSNRRICPECNAVYHLINNPPEVEGKCTNCGSDLLHRSDDKKNIILNRIKVYKEQTEPLVDFYRKEDKLFKVRGDEDIKNISNKIVLIIKKYEGISPC